MMRPAHPQRRKSSTPQGSTQWNRFSALFLSALLVVAVMAVGMVRGLVPIAAAFPGRTDIKMVIRQLSTFADASFPVAFRTSSGDPQAVVAVSLYDTVAEGLCVSGKVESPLGAQVLRITTAPGYQLRVAELQLAVALLADIDVQGDHVAVDRRATTADGVPIPAGGPSRLPIDLQNLRLRIYGTVRWVTISGMNLAELSMRMGSDVEECF